MSIPNPELVCEICQFQVDDPINLGQIMKKFSISVHYYCVLLSTKLQQRGRDSSGFLGFLSSDVKKEINKSKKRKCIYCNKIGASVQCDVCGKYFHLVCGLQNGTLHEFVGNFKSYCNAHVTLNNPRQHETTDLCRICYGILNKYNPVTSIMGKCCNFGWVHTNCMKKYALAAGYYLKCIWCKSSAFRDQVRYHGIFVPDRDANWELDTGTFAGLYDRYSYCDALDCICPMGRSSDKTKKVKTQSVWYLLICNTCGAYGIHRGCYAVPKCGVNEFTCKACIQVFKTSVIMSQKVQFSRTFRTLVDDHLEMTICNSDEKILIDESMYMVKTNEMIEDGATNKNVDATPKFKKLYRVDDETNQLVGIISAIVETDKTMYDYDEIEIIDEDIISSDDELESLKSLDLDITAKCVNEVLGKRVAVPANLTDKVDDKVDVIDLTESPKLENNHELENSILEILHEMQNADMIQVPRPIIERKN